MKRIGILGAMPEEINGIVSLLKGKTEVVKGMRTYYVGTINDIEVVVVFSRWGKVASATTVTHLIVEFGITELFFTGVAGAIHPDLNIGDVVIANSLIHHDLDARPILKRFEIPLLEKTILCPPKEMLDKVVESIDELISDESLIHLLSLNQREKFSLSNPKMVVGQIASGDRFFASHEDKENLLVMLPEVLCVEMEGAAVAQVCFEYNIPYVIIRTISDEANDNSVVDFKEFISQVASIFGVEIIKKLVKK
ncbi:5'-methylthioadenosine/adenosylhomocysteine nucleosidase [Flavobacterium taihuense]|uniref:5'-methylthioadenosine/adenosylhomocysteine nucleosidase n=1 Tax=Flavobacterium taihuense TaxID=2857508 RepID=A0ABS6XS77_9FLAO|nr:5'-methylthioadenosine/adenosylhomocysteine nucleosidase [Flavobacterium taihuense]MBW4359525.1 5'-methylthioadenosine/adenosylhomocysteine nucleosidase [Flavobacterium taihuense]